MNIQLSMFIFLSLFLHVEAQAPLGQENISSSEIVNAFRPSLAIVIGILSIMFSLTFLLLVYAKFCHSAASSLFNRGSDLQQHHGLIQSASRFSGIDKTVIESLPFFRFSALKGSKEGLECSVCLSKFEDNEILRLLPKCKHAFHIACVDKWLESHSSCPLCRHKVDADDHTIFTCSNSLRFSTNLSQLTEDPSLELFVEREQDNNHGSSRFSIGSSFRKLVEKGKKEEVLLIQQVSNSENDDDGKLLHKFKHKIIVSDVFFRNRWSDATSADLMFLNSEMINVMSSRRITSLESNSGRFDSKKFDKGSSTNEQVMKIKEEMERKRLFEGRINRSHDHSVKVSSLPSSSDSGVNLSNYTSRFLTPAETRSKSEITKLSRFADFSTKNRVRVNESSSTAGNNEEEERMRKLWFPIAKRTVQWLAGRERRLEQSHYSSRQPSLNV